MIEVSATVYPSLFKALHAIDLASEAINRLEPVVETYKLNASLGVVYGANEELAKLTDFEIEQYADGDEDEAEGLESQFALLHASTLLNMYFNGELDGQKHKSAGFTAQVNA